MVMIFRPHGFLEPPPIVNYPPKELPAIKWPKPSRQPKLPKKPAA